VSASAPPVLDLLAQVAHAVAQLRRTLEQLELPGLEPAVRQAQAALEQLQHYPGGQDALRQAIDNLPDAQRQQAQRQLEQARLDHEVNGELLKAALQRNAAMQAYTAQASASATYSSEGGVPVAGAGTLFGKF